MKFFHLSDLHLGKRVHDVSMLEDQAYILEEILRQIDLEQPDALLMAGDIYDKSVPPAEAVELLDKFLCQLAQKNLSVFISSGNHDSAERLAFGSDYPMFDPLQEVQNFLRFKLTDAQKEQIAYKTAERILRL